MFVYQRVQPDSELMILAKIAHYNIHPSSYWLMTSQVITKIIMNYNIFPVLQQQYHRITNLVILPIIIMFCFVFFFRYQLLYFRGDILMGDMMDYLSSSINSPVVTNNNN